MDWDGNNNNNNSSSSLRNFVSLAENSSLGFLYDFNHSIDHHHFPSNSAGALLMGDGHPHPEAHLGILAGFGNSHPHHLPSSSNDPKKKKLRGDQLELLERSFQEEIKLDPDRKLRLSRELGLQPRQVAVWFQNRRARWKAKQLERLYDVLKMEFDAVSREKLKLQEEVLRLKAMVGDAMPNEKQASAVGQTEISGEATAESDRQSNELLRCSTATQLMMSNPKGASRHHHHHDLVSEPGDQLSNVHEGFGTATAMNAYWVGGLPSYP
ncbi:hypothetical protein MLD38_020346 [Melastoma candidum]|uniref:Uncharacterized protein n=1 Tax=Melastoma candidum TaxID=119954 RepID=A0ACB9QDV5_9MYRT|nr:hypothetical protein MLD38_020346 [Melastoma candidum]